MTPIYASVLLADSTYWYRFKEFWLSSIREQNGMVLTALAAGAIGIAVICSGKWIK